MRFGGLRGQFREYARQDADPCVIGINDYQRALFQTCRHLQQRCDDLSTDRVGAAPGCASNAGLDGTFGNAGKLILAGNARVEDLVVQPDSMIIYARSMPQAGARRFRVGRLTNLGTRFGTGGIIDISFGFADAYDRAKRLVISNGRILVVGSVTNAANDEIGLARLRGDAMFADGLE